MTSLTDLTRIAALCLSILATEAAAQTIMKSFDGDAGPGVAVCQTGVTH